MLERHHVKPIEFHVQGIAALFHTRVVSQFRVLQNAGNMLQTSIEQKTHTPTRKTTCGLHQQCTQWEYYVGEKLA